MLNMEAWRRGDVKIQWQKELFAILLSPSSLVIETQFIHCVSGLT